MDEIWIFQHIKRILPIDAVTSHSLLSNLEMEHTDNTIKNFNLISKGNCQDTVKH